MPRGAAARGVPETSPRGEVVSSAGHRGELSPVEPVAIDECLLVPLFLFATKPGIFGLERAGPLPVFSEGGQLQRLVGESGQRPCIGFVDAADFSRGE